MCGLVLVGVGVSVGIRVVDEVVWLVVLEKFESLY